MPTLDEFIASGQLPAPRPPSPPVELGPKKVRWNHMEIIDFMLANPDKRQREIAAHFGLSESWLSITINSNSFKAALAERKEEIVNPMLTATLEERVGAVAAKSMEIVLERLTAPVAPSDDFLTDVAKMSLEAMGFGGKGPAQGTNNGVQVIVNLPGKSPSAQSWAERWQGGGGAPVDITPKEAS